MNFTATLFFNLTPNGNGAEHFAPPNATQAADWGNIYLTKLKNICQASDGKQSYIDISIYNYNFNEGYIDIDNINLPSNKYPTYIAIKANNPTLNYYLFYFINRVILISNGLRLYISEDFWAEHIDKAIFSNIQIIKTNKQIAEQNDIPYRIASFPAFNNNLARYEPAFGASNRISRNSLCIYAVFKHKTLQNISTAISEIHTYIFPIYDIVGKNISDNITKNDIINALSYIQSIYQVNDIKGGNGDAEVIKIYLLPQGTFSQATQAINFTGYLPNGNKKEVTALQAEAGELRQNINILNGVNFTPIISPYVSISALGKNIYLGTKTDGLELPDFVGMLGATIIFRNLEDSIEVIVEADNTQRDISTSFEVVGIANTSSLTDNATIAKWLGVAGNISSGVFQMASGGAGIVTGAVSIGGTLSNLPEKGNGTYIGGGTALITYKDIIDNGTGEFIFIVIKDGGNIAGHEEYSARKEIMNNGASCNYFILSDNYANFLEYISTRPFLINPQNNEIEYTVITALLTVDGIPYEAAEAISGEFEQGVKINFI